MMMLNQTKEKTAREVVEQQKDKLLLLGPVIGHIKNDLLNPGIARAYAIACRAGIIPPPPQQIMGMPLKVKYVSILAQAQLMARTSAMEQGLSLVGNIAAVFPHAPDLVNIDEVIRQYWEDLGISPKTLNDPAAVAQLRAAIQKQQQQQQQQQAMESMAKTGKTLSDTQLGGASALEHLAGIAGQGQVEPS